MATLYLLSKLSIFLTKITARIRLLSGLLALAGV